MKFVHEYALRWLYSFATIGGWWFWEAAHDPTILSGAAAAYVVLLLSMLVGGHWVLWHYIVRGLTSR